MTTLAAHDHSIADLAWWELALVGLGALVAGWVIWKAVMLTLRPGEEEPDHIKRAILEDDPPPPSEPGGDRPGAAGLGEG